MIRPTDEQWEQELKPGPEEYIPQAHQGPKPNSKRKALEAVLWILNTGAQWHLLQQSNPNFATVFFEGTPVKLAFG